MVDDTYDNLTLKEGLLSRISGNLLYYAHKKYTVTTSGSISYVDQAFVEGDSYAQITSNSLPIVVTVESTSGFPHGTIASALYPYIQTHGGLTADIKVELKTTSGTWITVYGPTSTTFSSDDVKQLGSTGSLTYPTDFPVKGLRFTISNFSGTAYIRQFGYHQYKLISGSMPFFSIGGDKLYGDLTFKDTGQSILWHPSGGWGYTTVENYLTPINDYAVNAFCSSVSPIATWDGSSWVHTTRINPTLYIDRNLFVQKDISTFGALMTSSDPQNQAYGTGGVGGGALQMGHGFTASSDMPCITLTDYHYQGTTNDYQTLWIKKSDGVHQLLTELPWGDLEIGNLTAHGNMWINGSWLNSSSTLYIGGASGAAVTLFANGNLNPIVDASSPSGGIQGYGLGSGSKRWAGISAFKAYLEGGDSNGPALWFQSWGTVGSYGGNIGIGLGNSNNMIFNSYSGGWSFHNLGTPTCWIDGSGQFHSPNSGQGGTYIDTWGNMHLNGGSWGHSWNVYNEYGNCIFNLPDSGGVTFYDGNGNAKVGISNGGNISTVGTMTIGSFASSSTPLYISGNTIAKNTSSIRFKENIDTLYDCSWIYQLRLVNFDWIDQERAKREGRQFGLIAEEVHELCPTLTWSDEEGHVEGVRYEMVGVAMVAELQKLRREVDELKAKLAAA
jgi:hypothetical protein